MDQSDPAALLDAFEDVLTSTLAFCRELPPESADLPTDCPGWSVRDQLAHIVALEQGLLGSPAVPLELPPLPHVQNDFDRVTEAGVQARRLLPLAAVADELAGLIPRRIGQLREHLAAGDDPEIQGPFGARPMSSVMSLRCFDTWAHEQDIRRAVGQPPRLDCGAAEVALARTLIAWERGLPKMEGVHGVLVVQVTPPHAAERRITLGAGGPQATIAGDAGALTWLGCGRGTLAAAQANGAIAATGSEELIAAIAPRLAFTP